MRTPPLALAILLLPAAAWPQPWRARVVARAGASGAYSTDPVQARVGDAVDLAVVLLGPRGEVLADVPAVRVDGRARPVRSPLPRGASVRWLQVEPRREHVDFPPPNPGVTSFSNAALFGPRHGRWLGYDRLEYTQREVTPRDGVAVTGASLRVSAARPGDPSQDTHGGAGSSWLAAAVALPGGGEARTPDASLVDRLGLSASVMRVSFRADDGFAGWLSTYFNVTSVFGSNGPSAAAHQTDRYTGADCADALVEALRASGRRELRYTSVAGIGEYARALTGVLRVDAGGVTDDRGGHPRLRWGAEVRPGDLATIDYADDPGDDMPRAWDHIGALVRDADGDATLSPGDVLRHMAARGLEDTALLHGGPMHVVLWRWRAAGTDRARHEAERGAGVRALRGGAMGVEAADPLLRDRDARLVALEDGAPASPPG